LTNPSRDGSGAPGDLSTPLCLTLSRAQIGGNLSELIECGLQVLNNLSRKNCRVRKIGGITEAVIS
jgi:hypothetical protein